MLNRCGVHSGDDPIEAFNSPRQEAPHPIQPKAPTGDSPWPRELQEQPMQANPHGHYQQRHAHQHQAQRRIGRNGSAQVRIRGTLGAVKRPGSGMQNYPRWKEGVPRAEGGRLQTLVRRQPRFMLLGGAVNWLMRRLSSGWTTLDEPRHRVDIAAPLPNSLDPPGHPSCRVFREDVASPRRVIERHIAADHHVDRHPGATL
jgi:hypothetical protein